MAEPARDTGAGGNAGPSSFTALRGALLYCQEDPFLVASALVHEPDGVILCCDGLIVAAGPAGSVAVPDGVEIADYRGKLIAPGFVDTHTHYVQTGMIGAQGLQLLDWLDNHTFPAERAFADPAHAAALADLFCDELLRHGVTTASVFCSVHPHSVDALFEAAARRGMRMLAGKVLMDRNAPPDLLDTAQRGYDESKALIERWHGRGRALYSITPRFAPTSTEQQLAAAGAMRREHPDVRVQSHVAENLNEVAWVKELFPAAASYLDVYERYGLAGQGAILAHGIHLDAGDLARCAAAGTALSHCPTSNLFLGSGLFDMAAAKAAGVAVGLGADIGAGTTFSMLATMGEAYKVAQLRGRPINAAQAFFLATLGGAQALGLDDRLGSLHAGNEADFVVLDPAATPLLAERSRRVQSVEEQLGVLMTLGDDRAVAATWIAGRPAHIRTGR